MRRWLAVLAIAGCGRLSFDALSDGGGQADGDGSGPDTPGQPAIPPGAGIWLQMETQPSAAIDSAGGHTVTCNGPCPTTAPGKHGQGFRFTMEEMNVVYAADLNPGAGYTAGIWVKLDSFGPAGSQACAWNKPFGGTNIYDTYTMCIDNTGNIAYDSENQAGTANSFGGATIPAVGEWHHLAMSWDGTTKRGYFDGAEVGSSTAQCGSNAESFTMGSEKGGYFLQGTVDDAVYYPRVLSAAEIMQLATP